MGRKSKRARRPLPPPPAQDGSDATTSPRASHRWAALVAAILSIVFTLVTVASSLRHSLTWDEPSFIGAGYAYLTRGEFRFNPSHPPLLQVIEAAPVVAMGPAQPPGSYEEWEATGNAVLGFGRELLFNGNLDPKRAAFAARLPIALLGGVLVFAVFLWTRRLYGDAPALVAAGLAAFCPNLIAHSGLATEDLGCTAAMFFAVWALWSAANDPAPRKWLVCGVAVGIALVSKYTALLLGPIILVIAAREILRDRARARDWTRGLAIVGATTVVVIAAAYGPHNGLALYWRGLRSIYGDLVGDHTFYLLGEFSAHGWWYYTLAAFVMKTPATTLLLIGAALAALAAGRGRAGRSGDDVWYLLVPAALIVGASMLDSANFGLRRILPAYPFILAFAARAMAAGLEARAPRLARIGVLLAVAATAAESVSIYPDHLSFFNVFAGGPGAGPRRLDDSNIDWGQDLPALAAWQRSHPEVGPIHLSYFGSAEPSAYGVIAEPMPQRAFLAPAPGYYAVSVQHLIRLREPALGLGPDADWLTKYVPVARAGHSIYIYRF